MNIERIKRRLEQLVYEAQDDLDTHYLLVPGYGSFMLWFQDDEREAVTIIWRDDMKGMDNIKWKMDPEEVETEFVDHVVDDMWSRYTVEDKLCTQKSRTG